MYIKPYSDLFVRWLLGSEENIDLLLSFYRITQVARSRNEAEIKLQHWLYFFKNEGLEEVNMETLIRLDADIAKTLKAYKRFTQDRELRDIYEEAHMKREMDIKTRLKISFFHLIKLLPFLMIEWKRFNVF